MKRRRLHSDSAIALAIAGVAADVETIKAKVELLIRAVGAVGNKKMDNSGTRDPSIAGFCARKGMSRAMYTKMRRAGKGPREIAIGNRRTISEQAELDWDAEREAEAAAITSQRAADLAAANIAAE